MKPTEIQESYTVNGKTFDNRYDTEKLPFKLKSNL